MLKAACVVEHDGKCAVEEPVSCVYTYASQKDFLFLADDTCYVIDYSNVVITDNTECDGVLAATLSCPHSTDNSVAETLAKLWGIRAILSMNLDASTACDEAKDFISINRLAAACHLEVEAL